MPVADQNLRSFIDAVPEGVLVAGADGVIVIANRIVERQFGYGPGELVGLSVDTLVPDDLRAGHGGQRDDFASAATTRTLGARDDVQGRRKDGSTFTAQIGLSVWTTSSGTSTIAVVVDLTERRNLEAQLRVAQKMEAIGQLAGGVAHDFNNLLTVIGTYTTLMIEDCADSDPRKEDLLEIMGASTRAATLTRQLLAFGRRQLLDSRILDLNEVVAGLEKMLRRVISAEIEMQIVRGEGIGAVHADAGQLEQVILNLVVNARDAMPSGGKLTIATGNVFPDPNAPQFTPAGTHIVAGGAAPAGPMVMLSVSDTGIGMDEQTMSRVFEPFFTTKEAGRGSGLGLSTTYGIAKQSGGHVRVRSQPGKGTTFEVLLPAVSAHVEPVEYKEYSEGDLRGSGLVLVAEDDDSVRRIVVGTLRKFGYEVIAASNGEHALALPLDVANAPVLLLTDVVMPSMSGRTLAEKMRERWPNLPVLFTSAYATDGVTGEAASDLPGALLRKPFVPGELAAAVRNTILHGGMSQPRTSGSRSAL